MLRLGRERTSLQVVFDQVGTPTYAADLADALLQIISAGNLFLVSIIIPMKAYVAGTILLLRF